MNIEKYLETIKSIQANVIEYLDREDNIEENYQTIINIFDNQKIRDNIHDTKLILKFILEIANNHHRYFNFFEKLEKLILYFREEIKQYFTNSEIFDYFQSNKRILLFIIKENLLIVDDYVIDKTKNPDYKKFFAPEFEEFHKNKKEDKKESKQNEKEIDFYEEIIGENEPFSDENDMEYELEFSDEDDEIEPMTQFYKNEDSDEYESFQDGDKYEGYKNDEIESDNKNEEEEEAEKESSTANKSETIPALPDDFDEKRMIGENDNYICEMIRKDLIEDFIVYVNRNELQLNSYIENSVYETNPLLIDERISLIKYAAFFGSIQIFKYLYLNSVRLKESLWIYAIHGDNAEIIHILEENQIKPKDKTYEECYEESISCHHNDIINYIEYNYITDKSKNYLDVYSFWYQHYNFQLIPSNLNEDSFFDLIEYEYYTLIELLIKESNIDINKRIEIIDDSYHKYYYTEYYYKESLESTPLAIAVTKGNAEIINLFLSQPNIDINAKIISNKSLYTYMYYRDAYIDKNKIITEEKPILLIAILSKNDEIIQMLMSKPNIDVNNTCIKKTESFLMTKTLLHMAVQYGNQKCVELLLSNANIDVNINYTVTDTMNKKIKEKTALNIAIDKQNVDIIQLLLSQPKIDVNFDLLKISKEHFIIQIPTLYEAFETKNINIIQLLLSNSNIIMNVDKVISNEEGTTIIKKPLIYAAVKGNNFEIVKLLLSYQAIDINSNIIKLSLSGSMEYPALFVPVYNQNAEIVQLLVSNPKIDVNKKLVFKGLRNLERTALFEAIMIKNSEIVRILLSNHKKIREFDDINNQHQKIISQKTALCLAILKQSPQIVQLLLSYPNIDVNIKSTREDKDKKIILKEEAPLYLAVKVQNPKIVQLLLSNQNIDVNITSFKLVQNKQLIETPISLAIQKQNVQIIQLLLSHPNIDLAENASNKQNNDKEVVKLKSLLDLAISTNNIEVIKLLLQRKEIKANKTQQKNIMKLTQDEQILSLIK